MRKLTSILMAFLAGIIISSCSSYTKDSIKKEEDKNSIPANEENSTITKQGGSCITLVSNRAVLSVNKDGRWIVTNEPESYISDCDVFNFYSLDGYLGKGSNLKIEKYEDGKIVKLDKNFSSVQSDKKFFKWFLNEAGISSQWNSMPRPPKVQQDNSIYENSIKEILINKKLEGSLVSIKQAVEIDIDNDGQDETIVTATDWDLDSWYNSAMKSGKGTYSVVMLRKIVNGKAQDIILNSQFSTNKSDYEYVFYAPFILDIDNDGQMEVILEGRYGSSSLIEFYKWENNSMKKIFETTFGA